MAASTPNLAVNASDLLIKASSVLRSSLDSPLHDSLDESGAKRPILDLACGTGRNGLYLCSEGFDVVFADKNEMLLSQVEQIAKANSFEDKCDTWLTDFEVNNFNELGNKSFAAVIVFRYLHRELFKQIKQAVATGGIVVYETFTEQQGEFGRPKNPDFLLKKGELAMLFSDWKILHSFEGVIENGVNKEKQAIAQIIAVKQT